MTHQYENTETRREQIATAALEILSEEGIHKVTTRSIAARVGITDGTIFRHFKDKTEILLASMDLLERLMFSAFPAPRLPPLERLERFFRSRALLIGAAHSLGRLIFSEQLLHAAGPAGRGKVEQWKQRNVSFVLACLSELELEGSLPEGLSAERLLPVVQGTLLTYAMLHQADNVGLSARVDRDWDTLSRLLTR
ncbi:MAG: TetR/AcrR family transcriptional regulator [Deltaproteobacteria bacterium]|nr:TetR/AcrR family transcriptional regulator [Deltaproteobacteria bacterium]